MFSNTEMKNYTHEEDSTSPAKDKQERMLLFLVSCVVANLDNIPVREMIKKMKEVEHSVPLITHLKGEVEG